PRPTALPPRPLPARSRRAAPATHARRRNDPANGGNAPSGQVKPPGRAAVEATQMGVENSVFGDQAHRAHHAGAPATAYRHAAPPGASPRLDDRPRGPAPELSRPSS